MELVLRAGMHGFVEVQWPDGAVTDGPAIEYGREFGLPELGPEGRSFVLLPKQYSCAGTTATHAA